MELIWTDYRGLYGPPHLFLESYIILAGVPVNPSNTPFYGSPLLQSQFQLMDPGIENEEEREAIKGVKY